MTTVPDISFAADVAAAVACMRRGGIVLYPTDTVWGIGCDAANAGAVARIFALKRRAEAKAMISLVDSTDMLRRYAGEAVALQAERIVADEPAERPVTVVIPDVKGLTAALMASDGSAAFRITGEDYSAALCRGIDGAVVSTSANISGESAAAVFSEISDDIIDGVDYVASYRRNDTHRSVPSKVVKLDVSGKITVIRP